LREAGWQHTELALLAGVHVRTIERYLSPDAVERGHIIPYTLQFTLEALARVPKPGSRQRQGASRKPKQ